MVYVIFFFKQKTAYEVRISDWSSDVCSSDLAGSARENSTDRRLGQKSAKRHSFIGIKHLPVKPCARGAGGFQAVQLCDDAMTAVHNRFGPRRRAGRFFTVSPGGRPCPWRLPCGAITPSSRCRAPSTPPLRRRPHSTTSCVAAHEIGRTAGRGRRG